MSPVVFYNSDANAIESEPVKNMVWKGIQIDSADISFNRVPFLGIQQKGIECSGQFGEKLITEF